MISRSTYSLITMGFGLVLMLLTPWALKESEPKIDEKMTLNPPVPSNIKESYPLSSNPPLMASAIKNTQPSGIVTKNIEYLKDIKTGGLEAWGGQEIISKDIVYQEDDTYAIRTVFKTRDNKKLLLLEMFSQDLNPIAEEAYRAEVLEIDVLPSHYPAPPQYPPTPVAQLSRSKSTQDLQRLSQILNKSVRVVPTGNPLTGESESLNEGYRILVPAPNTPQEIFDLYKEIQRIAGASGVVKLQKP